MDFSCIENTECLDLIWSLVFNCSFYIQSLFAHQIDLAYQNFIGYSIGKIY